MSIRDTVPHSAPNLGNMAVASVPSGPQGPGKHVVCRSDMQHLARTVPCGAAPAPPSRSNARQKIYSAAGASATAVERALSAMRADLPLRPRR